MKVYLGCPTGGKIIDETVICLLGIATSTRLHRIHIQHDTYCDRGHNQLVQDFLDSDSDALMFVDSDQEFPRQHRRRARQPPQRYRRLCLPPPPDAVSSDAG